MPDQIAFNNSKSDTVCRVSSLTSWPPYWILELNNFSNSESGNSGFHQVSAQSDLQFGRCGLKNFKMAAWHHLGYHNGTIFSNSESL